MIREPVGKDGGVLGVFSGSSGFAPSDTPARSRDASFMINRVLPLSAALLLFAFAASACNVSVTFGEGIDGSGVVVTETYDLDDFDEIRVGSAFEVDIEVGPEASVEVQADDNFIEFVEIEVDGDELQIGFDESLRDGTLRATVTLPQLTDVDVSGASDVSIIGIDATDLDIEVSGASEVTASGSADSLRLDVSGASDVRLDGLTVATAQVDINGASDVELGAAETVRGDLAGASDLSVSADSSTNVTTSGAATLERS